MLILSCRLWRLCMVLTYVSYLCLMMVVVQQHAFIHFLPNAPPLGLAPRCPGPGAREEGKGCPFSGAVGVRRASRVRQKHKACRERVSVFGLGDSKATAPKALVVAPKAPPKARMREKVPPKLASYTRGGGPPGHGQQCSTSYARTRCS